MARVLLIGNYLPDAQESMQRFAETLAQGLPSAGWEAELVRPAPVLRTLSKSKYVGYLDKFALFPSRLRRAIHRAKPAIVHICDHSNAMYSGCAGRIPVLATCHDLLAVRAGLGEETDCPASALGVWLQRWIVRGLSRANRVACCSTATMRDAERILPRPRRLTRIPLGLNYPYRPLPASEAAARLEGHAFAGQPYLLHVGSSQPRKNRDGILRIFARISHEWPGGLVFAGEPLTPELHALAASLRVSARVHQVAQPTNALLEALYGRATALLFPSRFEGFGWPIIEAQACGCPVIAADTGPLPEVVGKGGLLCPLQDEEAFARAVLRLTQADEHREWSRRGLENAGRFNTARMVQAYADLYREMAAPNS